MNMSIEEYFDFLRPDDIRLKGTRIGIESVLYEYLHHGRTPEEIAARFHTLTPEQVYATILYYLRNKAAVSRYVADWLEWSGAMREEQERNPSPAIARLRALKAGQAPSPSKQTLKYLLDEYIPPAFRAQILRRAESPNPHSDLEAWANGKRPLEQTPSTRDCFSPHRGG
jgi:uncharacterized protein (DUF433 family)